MLIVNVLMDCYAFSVRMVKIFQDVVEMVLVIPGIIVMTQTVHVIESYLEQMMILQQACM